MTNSAFPHSALTAQDLTFLSLEQVKMIDEALDAIDKFGEVRLILENNKLRFIVCQMSYDALNYQFGSIKKLKK